ncbi:MAG: hypothetical protein IKD23_06820 [Lentisphaeria bacterium]|nr:hypothetical protein [Lentisphaeria bacterium]
MAQRNNGGLTQVILLSGNSGSEASALPPVFLPPEKFYPFPAALKQ